ncbi:MAG TPA: carbohydrate ABC transporter permease [Acidimicrobiales bacterium]|jgi:multiple sugar transport system permease protein|nr:carbohydrate ABC transporter permease [Acidimicrobiales bacterium]
MRTLLFRRRGLLVVVYAVAIVGSAFALVPVLWMISTALKGDNAVFSVPPQLVPASPKVSNFHQATTLIPFWHYLRNSLLVAGLGALGTVFSAALVAYPLARLKAPGMKVIFALVVATLLLPQQVLLISQFLIFKRLGWYGTYLPLIVPSWLGGGGFNVFLLRQFFLTLPPELDQAALADGAGHFRIFFRIILPQSVPALLAVGLLDFASKWNDFLGPLIYLNRTSTYTLPLGLASFRDLYNTAWNYLMAGTILAVVPCVVLFFLGQRLLVRGLAVRAKG